MERKSLFIPVSRNLNHERDWISSDVFQYQLLIKWHFLSMVSKYEEIHMWIFSTGGTLHSQDELAGL